MRPLPLLMAALVTLGLYFWVVHPTGAQDAAAPDPVREAAMQRPVKVVAFDSRARPVDSAIVLRGRTEAHRNVELRAETSGLIVSEPRRAGTEVAAGDLLCRIESGSREAELAQARAALAQAEADNSAAQKLSERGYTAETTAMARKAALEAAAATVRQVELDIARLEIRAPFSGVLESDTAELGALLRAGDSCATLISLSPIDIIGFVPEIDVDRLRTGMMAEVRLVSGRMVTGEVTFVSRSADAQTRTFRVEIAAPNADGTIRDGMTADTRIPVEGGSAHLVPQAALTLNDDGAMGVRVADGDTARFISVEVLREDLDGLWLRGLPDEARIIIVGQDYVSDGSPIEVTMTERDLKG